MHYLDETHIFLFLVQFALLLGLAKIAGEPFRRAKQPTLTAEILVGIFLGPTVLGRLLPGVFQKLFPADAVQQNTAAVNALVLEARNKAEVLEAVVQLVAVDMM